jgi:ribose transport system substrate-binding protein
MSDRRIALWTVALVALIAAIAYRISVFSEPPPPPTSQIVFITGGSGPYWQSAVSGAKSAARDVDVELAVAMPQTDESLEQQMDILMNLDESVDGIALSPIDAAGQTHLINQLVEKMRVVTFDSDAELSERHSHVGTSNFSAGRTCARMVGEALPDGGQIAVLMANQTKENLIDRRSGFQERISQMANNSGDDPDAPPRFVVVGYYEDNGSDQRCAENIRQALTKFPGLDCFVGLNARHGPVLITTLKELGKLGKVKLVTFDALDPTLDGIESGQIYATIAQDPYNFGYQAVTTLAKLCQGHGTDLPIVGRGSNYLGAEAIKHDNLDKFRSRLRERKQATETTQPTEDKPAA